MSRCRLYTAAAKPTQKTLRTPVDMRVCDILSTGMTVKAVADAMGVHEHTVQGWIRGVSPQRFNRRVLKALHEKVLTHG